MINLCSREKAISEALHFNKAMGTILWALSYMYPPHRRQGPDPRHPLLLGWDSLNPRTWLYFQIDWARPSHSDVTRYFDIRYLLAMFV